MARHEYCPECSVFLGEDDWDECPNCGADYRPGIPDGFDDPEDLDDDW